MAEAGLIRNLAGEDVGTQSVTRGRAEGRRVPQTSRQAYDSFDTGFWEHTYFNGETGGYVVTDRRRITQGDKNKQTREVFNNEQEILKFFADKGFRVEHLSEPPRGMKSPDARMSKGNSVARLDGELVEIKNTKSVSNVVKYGTEAVHEKGAQKVVYRFTERNPELVDKIHELARKGIHGYYYFSGDKDYVGF